MAIPGLLTSAVETAINQAINLAPAARQTLAELADKVIAIRLSGLEVSVYIFPGVRGLSLQSQYEDEADAQIQAPPFSLLRLLLKKDEKLLSVAEVTVSGDTEVAERFISGLRELEVDWQGLFTKQFGDIPAYWMGQMAETSRNWGQHGRDALEQSLRALLQKQTHLLPTREEFEAFTQEAEHLQTDTDRLEQRVKRLQDTVR
ncbi:MAG: hypothetical protein GY862_14675 [Gammaproteobacteria bacterium]|nr:hypothetical protein [Gammaproteobacteria bacterium]